jgi:DNA primase
MAINFEDFIEQVRDANPIETVIEESGIRLRGHGRLRVGVQHDSLKVRTDMQRAFWYSHNWHGDVFGWVMREKGCEFGEALRILAQRTHIEMPKFQAVNEGEVQRARATADAFSVAAAVFHRWLVGDEKVGTAADAEALAYVRGRGWSDETIQTEMVGFSGRKSEEQVRDMVGEFNLFGVDVTSPAAVAVLGFRGDVDHWASLQGLRVHPDFDPEWIVNGRIHGLMDVPGVIYSHVHKGKVVYLSRRHLPGHDTIKSEGKAREWKSFNPYKLLAGPKQVYFNRAHRTDRPLVMVEGQGDAITWGQWGHGAMAWCGLLGDPQHLGDEDRERLLRLVGYLRKHPALYLHLDEDEAGQKGIRDAAKLLGAKVQIVKMTRLMPREDVTKSEDKEDEE